MFSIFLVSQKWATIFTITLLLCIAMLSYLYDTDHSFLFIGRLLLLQYTVSLLCFNNTHTFVHRLCNCHLKVCVAHFLFVKVFDPDCRNPVRIVILHVPIFYLLCQMHSYTNFTLVYCNSIDALFVRIVKSLWSQRVFQDHWIESFFCFSVFLSLDNVM